MFRFLKRNDSEGTLRLSSIINKNPSLVLMVFSFTVCGEKSQRTKCLKNINVLTI